MSTFRHGDRTVHGRAAEYRSWISMRQRCLNPNCHAYPKYGGVGISICERWNDYVNFLSDMGRRPTLQHTLDRINTYKGYSPKNCRWATKKEQGRNRKDNKVISFNGKTQCVAKWADDLLIPKSVLYQRLDDMPIEKAFSLPYKV